MFFKYINSNRQTSVFTELRWFNSFRFVKLHTSNYMYSGTQKMIELALFTIVRFQLCTIEKVIYKTKLDEYIYFVGLDNAY